MADKYVPSNLDFTVEQRSDGLLIQLVGELGLPPHTDKLQHELTRIYALQPSLLVFDLSRLTFVSSLGIGILAEANRSLRRGSGKLRLCCVVPKVMEVFERTRMTSVFQFASNLEDAFSPA
jgi:anti-anti-sigma factor